MSQSPASVVTVVRDATPDTIYVVANGDLRLSANQVCWSEQQKLEAEFSAAVREAGLKVVRAHPFKEEQQHGFIQTQAEGIEALQNIPEGSLIAVVEGVWQSSHHVLAMLIYLVEVKKCRILVVANWSGTWPGLVGASNLAASLRTFGVPYSLIWARKFSEPKFKARLAEWLEFGKIQYYPGPMTPIDAVQLRDDEARRLGAQLGLEIQARPAVITMFDAVCMGMMNAEFSKHWMYRAGIAMEHVSQSDLMAEADSVSDEEAAAVYDWYKTAGMKFHLGPNDAEHLTEAQILRQCKCYIGTLRISDRFGASGCGLQYQQGLARQEPATDLYEGTLNDPNRPPVRSADGKRVLYENDSLPCANEVDMGAAVDGQIIKRAHRALGQPFAHTQQDVRWGSVPEDGTTDAFLWDYLLSGSNPPEHCANGWAGAEGFRQPAMYFKHGGSTLRIRCKAGEVIRSRVFEEQGKPFMHIGRGYMHQVSEPEYQRRWNATTKEWPLGTLEMYGMGPDEEQFFCVHPSNHDMQAYADSPEAADRCVLTRAYMAQRMGIEVVIRGTRKNNQPW